MDTRVYCLLYTHIHSHSWRLPRTKLPMPILRDTFAEWKKTKMRQKKVLLSQHFPQRKSTLFASAALNNFAQTQDASFVIPTPLF